MTKRAIHVESEAASNLAEAKRNHAQALDAKWNEISFNHCSNCGQVLHEATCDYCGEIN